MKFFNFFSSNSSQSQPTATAHSHPKFIPDQYSSLEEVQDALQAAGLESSNLIIGVDFTKSNEWTGKRSFQGRGLHTLSPHGANPYQQAMAIIGKTLERFDDDQLIPCYGFGDISTQDEQVFSFLPDEGSHQGMAELLRHYGELVPHVKLSGPTSFAPLIYKAIEIVQKTGQYHILLIVADGQVTRPSHLQPGEYSRQEQQTIDAIVAASHHALSIVMVGVGDGPWEQMIEFDDQLPTRQFDNFQFVNFTDIQSKYGHTQSRMEAAFALSALMEIPEQYQAIQAQGLLKPANQPTAALPALPPPTASTSVVLPTPKVGHPTTNEVAAKENTPPKTNHRHSSHSKSSRSNSNHDGFSSSSSSGGGGRSPKSNSSSSRSVCKSPKKQHKKKAPATSEPPAIFLCPITQDLMDDPVVAADGYTYERQAIQQWLGSHDNSPMTNLAMEHKNLIPNHMLRSMIRDQVAA